MTFRWRDAEAMISNISSEVSDDYALESHQFSWVPSEIAFISKWAEEQKESIGACNSRVTDSSPDVNTNTTNSSTSGTDHRDPDTMELRKNRKPPNRYVARPSIVGFTNEEGDQRFLNDGGCTPNHRRRCCSTPKAAPTPKVSSLDDFGQHTDEDLKHINPAHCFARSEMIEPFIFQQSPSRSQQGSHFTPKQGQVGFRCRHCKLCHGKRKKFHTVFPQSLKGIYRSIVVRLQTHIR